MDFVKIQNSDQSIFTLILGAVHWNFGAWHSVFHKLSSQYSQYHNS